MNSNSHSRTTFVLPWTHHPQPVVKDNISLAIHLSSKGQGPIGVEDFFSFSHRSHLSHDKGQTLNSTSTCIANEYRKTFLLLGFFFLVDPQKNDELLIPVIYIHMYVKKYVMILPVNHFPFIVDNQASSFKLTLVPCDAKDQLISVWFHVFYPVRRKNYIAKSRAKGGMIESIREGYHERSWQ